jgi:ABC-type sugar transport system substrate-binding protein
MKTSTRSIGRGARRFGAASAILALVIGAAACGSSGTKAATTTAAGATTTAAGAATTAAGAATTAAGATTTAADAVAAGIAHANAEMAKYLPEPPPFTSPGPKVTGDIASLKGKVVWFLPIAYQFVPYFAVVEKGLKEAFAKVGMTVRTCDAAADPTKAASCVSDATSSHAAAIITDAVTHEFAPNAFDAAQAAGIAVVYMDTGYPSETGNKGPWPKLTAYATFDGAKATALVADWMIVDSKGEANVLAIRVSDTDWTKATMTNGAVAEFGKYCPKCHVVVVDSNAAQTAERPSVVAGAIAANPSTNYVLPNYDSTVEPSGAFEGLQNAGYLNKVKGGTTTGQLSGLQRIKDGQFLYVNAGANNYEEAWVGADQAIRLLLGNPPIMDPVVQLRLFTKDNVSKLTLTQDAYLTGSFFGSSGFQAVYTSLWGVG